MTQPRQSSIDQRQQRLIDDFNSLDGWSDRYQHLADLGRRMPAMPVSLRTEQNRVRECRADTFLAGLHEAGRVNLAGASDAPVLAGILAVLVELYSGEPPASILRHPPIIFDRIGLTRQLSPHRRIALLHIHERLTTLATGFTAVRRLAS